MFERLWRFELFDTHRTKSNTQSQKVSGETSSKNGDTHVEDRDVSASGTTLPTTARVMFFAVFVGLGGWLLNFDLTYSGTVLQMNAFKSSFGHCSAESVSNASSTELVCTVTALQQSLTNLSSLFIGLGALSSGFLGSWLGRRTCIQVGCAIQAIGAAGSTGTAGNFVAYIACKCVTGFGLGLLYTTTVPYGIEFMPPHRRGALIGLFNIGLCLGSLCMSLVCLGTSSLDSNWAWKTPIICAVPVALIYGTLIMLFPESPRWLVVNGRDKAAADAFLRMYKGHLTMETAESLAGNIKQHIDADREMASGINWFDIFRRRYVRRLLSACLVTIASALCGSFFVNMYAAIFFGQLHVAQNPFVLTVIISACALPGACVGPFVAEGLGRRRAQLFGYGILGTLMLVIGVVNSCLGSKNPASVTVLITLLCIWQTVLNALVTSTNWLLASELHTVRLRTYGQAFVMGVTFVFQFASVFYTPYMINPGYGNMGINITYFFFGLSALFLVLIYLIVPETGQLSLEQLDDYLDSEKRAWRTSLRKNRAMSRGLDG